MPDIQEFPQPQPGHRDWYAYEALRALPRLILMADKNPFSRTYGCFDRQYWHYRTMDFPCGMNQEFVLPLALAYKLQMPNNPYYGLPRMKELVEAGIDFARESSYPNGSCDDYFPFERALGALVFSLYAMTESAIELDLREPRHLEFFALRGDWLREHNETGQLANHQAFAALALYNVYILTGEKRFLKASNSFRDLTLSWQDPEGWFQEYEGADPGYHTCSIGFLTKLWQKTQDERLIEPIGRAVDFAVNFMHPDGSYGGEYGSRNTYHFYPHGFEVMASRFPNAANIAETFLQRSMPERRRYYNDDDRMAAHYVYDWMQAWRDYSPERGKPIDLPKKLTAKWFEGAEMLVVRGPQYHAVAAANKGGVFKAFDREGPIASDTGLIGELDDGRVVVTHIVDRNKVKIAPDHLEIEVSGVFQRRRAPLSTPFKQIVFRVLLLTIGRFHANAVRFLLQKILITGKARTSIQFRRRLAFREDAIAVVDEVQLPRRRAPRFHRLAAGSDATSIYVANSNVFQESVLMPWTWFQRSLKKLNSTGRMRVRRRIFPRGQQD
ncbi:hypothetical protein KQI84_04195 [bacterium]|nr:hypothetical protein [bacterium]